MLIVPLATASGRTKENPELTNNTDPASPLSVSISLWSPLLSLASRMVLCLFDLRRLSDLFFRGCLLLVITLQWTTISIETDQQLLFGCLCSHSTILFRQLKSLHISLQYRSTKLRNEIHTPLPWKPPKRLPNLHPLFFLRMRRNPELERLISNTQDLEPKMLIAEEVLLDQVA